MNILIMSANHKQSGNESCFIGGKPKLPLNQSIPLCSLCGMEQTFFFQIGFPEDHDWAGLTLTVFACTQCADQNYLIPEMLSDGSLSGCNIPMNFLSTYQRNFRFIVFRTDDSRVVHNYQEILEFHEIILERGSSSNSAGASVLGHLGGTPFWILEDESPQSYDSSIPMCFLFQICCGIEFSTVQGAPPQVEIGLTGKPERSPFSFYQLFIGNAIYFFGTKSPVLHLVYAVTQVD